MKSSLTEDAHYTDIGVAGPGGHGPDGVIARIKLGLEPLEGYEHLPGTNMIAEGDLVMTEHTERWVFGTGEVIDHSFVSVTQLREGRIFRVARLFQYFEHHGQCPDMVARVSDHRAAEAAGNG